MTESRHPPDRLASAAIAGDQAALRALWETHRRYVAAVLLAHKPACADMDDLLQDVAISLVAKIHTLDEPGAFLPWLRMVALNVARLAARKHNASPVRASLDALADAPTPIIPAATSTPLASATGRDDATSLLALASQLPDDYREPLLLRCLHDMSYRQIAEALALPETTVETRIARGRRMLRELAARSSCKPPSFPPATVIADGIRPAAHLHKQRPVLPESHA